MTLRSLADRVGVSPSHLSRVLRQKDYKAASGPLAGRIARELDLPVDYFPEYREHAVVEAVRHDAAMRDLLFDRLK